MMCPGELMFHLLDLEINTIGEDNWGNNLIYEHGEIGLIISLFWF